MVFSFTFPYEFRIFTVGDVKERVLRMCPIQSMILTLNPLTSTIVAPSIMLANGRWDLIRRLRG